MIRIFTLENMKWIVFISSLLFFDQLMAKPIYEEEYSNSARPDERSGFYEGDILFRSTPTKVVSTNPSLRWPNPVPYYIDPVLINHTATIQLAMNEFHRSSCVRFVQLNEMDRPNWPTDYLHFHNSTGCSSFIGRQGGTQYVSLEVTAGCMYKGVIMHEIFHALGFWHEHNRPDRDQYILVLLNNTIPSMVNNFEKYNANDVDFFGESYDFGSIMHGSGYFMSINDTGLRTMVAKNDSSLFFGQRFYLSDSDIRRLNIYYGCLPPTTASTSTRVTTTTSTTTKPTTRTTPTPTTTTTTPTTTTTSTTTTTTPIPTTTTTTPTPTTTTTTPTPTTTTTTPTPTTTSKPSPTTGPSMTAPTLPIPIHGICNGTVEFLPYSGDCRKYYRCNGLLAYEMTCPSGLYFNLHLNVCDWPFNVDCFLTKDAVIIPVYSSKNMKINVKPT